jgi:glutamine amidotransferase
LLIGYALGAMGKMAAYLGPAVKISAIVEEGTQSLLRQSADHADGFGLGWYPADRNPEPLTYSSDRPIWRDATILDIARRYESHCAVASVRRSSQGDHDGPRSRPATGGRALHLDAAQPFHLGPYMFHHEGELARFQEVFERPLRSKLSDRSHRWLRGSTASELLFATWLDAMGEHRTADSAANALEKMVDTVREIAGPAHASATLAIIVSDGTSLVTLRTAIGGTPPAMYTIVADEGAPFPKSARVIASEPLFKGSWTALEPHSLVIFTSD